MARAGRNTLGTLLLVVAVFGAQIPRLLGQANSPSIGTEDGFNPPQDSALNDTVQDSSLVTSPFPSTAAVSDVSSALSTTELPASAASTVQTPPDSASWGESTASTLGIETTPLAIEATSVLDTDTMSIINSSPIPSSVTMQATSEVVTVASSTEASTGITSDTSNNTEDSQDVTDASTQGFSTSLSSLDVTSEGIPEPHMSMASVTPSMSNPTFDSSDAALDASSALVASAAVTSDVPLSSVSVTSASIDAASAWSSRASDNVLSSILYTPTPSLNLSDTYTGNVASDSTNSILAPSVSDFMSGTVNIEATPSVTLPDQSEHLNFSASPSLASTVQSSVNDFNATYTSASFFATPAPSVISPGVASSPVLHMTSLGSDHVTSPGDNTPYTPSPSVTVASIQPASTFNLSSSHVVVMSNDSVINGSGGLDVHSTMSITPSFTENYDTNASASPAMTTAGDAEDGTLPTPPPDISANMTTNQTFVQESVTTPFANMTDDDSNQTSTNSMAPGDQWWPTNSTTDQPMDSSFLTLSENVTSSMHTATTEQPVVNASSPVIVENSTAMLENNSSASENASLDNSTLAMIANMTSDSDLNDTIIDPNSMTTASYFNSSVTLSVSLVNVTSRDNQTTELPGDFGVNNTTIVDYNVTDTSHNDSHGNVTSSSSDVIDAAPNVTDALDHNIDYDNITPNPINVTFIAENVTRNSSDSTHNYTSDNIATTPSYFNETFSNGSISVTVGFDSASQIYNGTTIANVTESSNITETHNVTVPLTDSSNGTYDVTTAPSNVTSETSFNSTISPINNTEGFNWTIPAFTTESANFTDSLNASDLVTEIPSNVTTQYVETDDVISATTAYQTTDNTTSADVNTTSAFFNTTFNMTEVTEMTTEFEFTTTPYALNSSELYDKYWIKTVLEVDPDVNVSDPAYWLDMEERFLMLYDEAFNVATTSYRRRRAATVDNTTVQMINITRLLPHQEQTAFIYLIEQDSAFLAPQEAIAALTQLNDQDVTLILGHVVVIKAQAYVPEPPPPDRKLWIIGAVLGGLVGAIGLCWCTLFIYFKCTRPAKSPRSPRSSARSRTIDPDMAGLRGSKILKQDIRGFDIVRTEVGLENELHRDQGVREDSYRRRPEGSTELEGMYSADDTPPPRKPKSPTGAQVSPEGKVKAGKSKGSTVEALRPLPSKPPPPKSRRPPTKAGRKMRRQIIEEESESEEQSTENEQRPLSAVKKNSKAAKKKPRQETEESESEGDTGNSQSEMARHAVGMADSTPPSVKVRSSGQPVLLPALLQHPLDTGDSESPHEVRDSLRKKAEGERKKNKQREKKSKGKKKDGKKERENYKKVQQEIGAILGETPDMFAQKKKSRRRNNLDEDDFADGSQDSMEMRDIDRSRLSTELDASGQEVNPAALEEARVRMHALLDDAFALIVPGQSRRRSQVSSQVAPSPQHTPMYISGGPEHLTPWSHYTAGDEAAKIIQAEYKPNGHIPSQPIVYDNPSYSSDTVAQPSVSSKRPFSNAVHPMASQPPSQRLHQQPTDGYTSLAFDAAIFGPSSAIGPPHSPPERDLNGPLRTKSRSQLSLIDTMSESSTDREAEGKKSNLTRSDSKSEPLRRKIAKGSLLEPGDDEIDVAEKAIDSNKDNPQLTMSIREELERLSHNRTALDTKSSAIA